MINLGTKIDMLTIKEFLEYKIYNKNKCAKYLCECDCGNTIEILESTLKNKSHYHSCGCYQKKFLTSGDSSRCSKAGKNRKNSFVNNSNIQMTFRQGTIKGNTSGTQGVSWSTTSYKWHVYVGYQNYRCNLGFYEDKDIAIKVRNMAEDAIKENSFEDFFYQLRGFYLKDRIHKQFKKTKK